MLLTYKGKDIRPLDINNVRLPSIHIPRRGAIIQPAQTHRARPELP